MADKENSKGHAAHTQDAGIKDGLGDTALRPMKITMLGAGSFFTPRLVNDVLRIPEAEQGEIVLVDIDVHRLEPMHRLIRMLIDRMDKSGWSVTASTDRREVLKGSDYIVNCIEVSGLESVKYDYEIPARYGVYQCIGDTIAPGGIFKGLRTIPVWVDILRDAERLCPDAVVLNYTNPMSMLCLAASRTSTMHVVGLCHSVQGTSRHLARRAGVPFEEMEWECAGINHMAWFTTLKHKGNDLYPLLKDKARQDLAGNPSDPDDAEDLVRKDIMLQFGYFVTESSGHFSEYVPYYRKRDELIQRYCGKAYEGESGFYAREWPTWRVEADRERQKMLDGEYPIGWERSWEYASWIIEAREKDSPYRIHGNVPNRARGAGPLVSNLPHEGCVEVACMVDRNGIHPTVFGTLPPQLAGLCRSNMGVYECAVDAALEKNKEAAIHAMLLDPLTAAVCSPDEIRRMTLELFEAEALLLKGFK